MRNGGIDKRVYVGEFVGSHFVHQPRKRWIDSVNDCPKKTCFNVGTERRMMCDRNEWREFIRGNGWGHSPEDEPLRL